MYEILEVCLASVRDLYEYHQKGIYGTNFDNLKGVQYPWVLSNHAWRQGEKVLDVGAAYSPLPLHIQETYGCEVWGVDDFGLGSNEPYWTRSQSPQEYIAAHPQIKYVLERLGDPGRSTLPEGAFDLVYSASTLEHIPGDRLPAAWKHMDQLLRPGGEMLHAVDIPFPSNFGVPGMAKVWLMDWFFAIMPRHLKTKHYLISPKTYARLAFQAIGVHFKPGKNLSMLNMALNPDVFVEGYQHGYHRIVKDGNKNYRFERKGSLNIHLRKLG